MSGIDRWLLPPEAFCLRKKFPRCISFSCFCSILPNWRMSNAGDNDGSASHRILHGDCDRLFGVLAILDQSTPQGRANLEKLQTSLKRAVILALAFTLTTGMALTAAFGFGLIPLGF